MEKHIKLVAKTYDDAILGVSSDPYKNLPKHITNTPEYQEYIKANALNTSDSGRKEVKGFLSPTQGMQFIDLGCCLNLMFNGYDEWKSTYHGIDISCETINLLKKHIAKNKLDIGSLYFCGVDQTPHDADSFDIGACIGVLEYFAQDYVKRCIREMHRIIKPNGKLVIDVPNLASPLYKANMMLEEHAGRPNKYNLIEEDLSDYLSNYFTIEKIEKVAGMNQYFLVNKK